MMQSVSLPSIKLQTANDYNFGLKTEKVAVTQLVSKKNMGEEVFTKY